MPRMWGKEKKPKPAKGIKTYDLPYIVRASDY